MEISQNFVAFSEYLYELYIKCFSVIVFITHSINYLRFGASSPPIIFPLGLASTVRIVRDIAKVKRNNVFILTSLYSL